MPSILLERTSDTREDTLTAEALAHKQRMSEIYNLVFSAENDAVAAASAAEVVGNAVREAEPETEPAYAPAPVLAPEEPATKKNELFADFEYKDHRLYKQEVASTPAATAVEEDEDALPTRRTMDTLRRSATVRPAQQEETVASVQTMPKAKFWESLSFKAKLAIAIVSVVVVVAIALVCINTGIINSMQADIVAKQAQLQGLAQQSQNILGQIKAVTDPAYVDEYAEFVLGMVHP